MTSACVTASGAFWTLQALKLSRISGLPVPQVTQLVQFLREHTDTLPSGNPELEALDRALASCAIETAVTVTPVPLKRPTPSWV